MKAYFIFCCLLVSHISAVDAQTLEANVSGLYLTQQDFVANNISHLAKSDNRNYLRVGSNESLIVYRGAEKEKFKFKNVFGYVDGVGTYRKFGATKLFTKYGYAKIIDDRGLILYSARYATHKVGRIHYFYSVSKDSPMKVLSIKNLKTDFAENTEFLLAIEKLKYRHYSTQTDGKYIINDFFLKSINK